MAQTGATNSTLKTIPHYFGTGLGNTRLTFSDVNNNKIVDVPEEILQESHYYPFGMNASYSWMNNATLTDNAYQYNGKELNEDFGLNLNDYGARWYDGAVGRWWSVDPMGEKYNGLSPYNYAQNRPSGLIDVDGNYVIVPYLLQNDLNDLNQIVQRYFGSSIKLDVSNRPIGVDNSSMMDAKLTLVGNGGKLSAEKKVVFDYLTRIFDDKNNTARIQLDNAERNVDPFHEGYATVNKFKALMNDESTGVSNLDMGMFVHEVSEQWYKQTILGLPHKTGSPKFGEDDTAYSKSHMYALVKESLVTGMLRASMETSGYKPNLAIL